VFWREGATSERDPLVNIHERPGGAEGINKESGPPLNLNLNLNPSNRRAARSEKTRGFIRSQSDGNKTDVRCRLRARGRGGKEVEDLLWSEW
jgi:hypothetical protein